MDVGGDSVQKGSQSFKFDIPVYIEQTASVVGEKESEGPLGRMYQDYIDGKRELREINMEFNARYVKGEDYFCIDSKPIEVCRFARSKRCTRMMTDNEL